MNKKEAIKTIKEIRIGSGLDREKYPESKKGALAKDNWYDGKFSLGMEYGYILALMDIFNIK